MLPCMLHVRRTSRLAFLPCWLALWGACLSLELALGRVSTCCRLLVSVQFVHRVNKLKSFDFLHGWPLGSACTCAGCD